MSSPITGDIVSEINEQLPDEIRVLGCVRVTKHFNAWKLCDKRQYEYCLPIWLVDQNSSDKGMQTKSRSMVFMMDLSVYPIEQRFSLLGNCKLFQAMNSELQCPF